MSKLFFHPKRDLMNLLLSGVGRRVAITTLGVFTPIYIFTSISDFGLDYQVALTFVIAYYLVYFSVKEFSLIVAENLSQKIGFKGTIWVSTIAFLAFIPTIVLAANTPFLFYLASVFMGVHLGAYWWGYHGFFIVSGDKRHYGEAIGEADLLAKVAFVVAPVLGAVVISIAGFNSLYILSAIIVLASLVVLGKDHDRKPKRDVRVQNVLGLLLKHKDIAVSYVGTGGYNFIASNIFSLFLFLFIGRIIDLGAFVSLSILVSAIFSVFVGKLVDTRGGRKLVAIGSPIVFVSWVIRYVWKTIPVFILAVSMSTFGDKMISIPLSELTYKKATEDDVGRAILFRETALIIGAILALIVLWFVIYIGRTLEESFLLASLFSLLPLISVVKGKIHDKSA